MCSKTHDFLSVCITFPARLNQNKLSSHPLNQPLTICPADLTLKLIISYYNCVLKWHTQLAQQPPCKDQVFDWCKQPPAAHHWSHPEWPNVPCLCSHLWSRTQLQHGNRQTHSVCWTVYQSRANAHHIHCVKQITDLIFYSNLSMIIE